MLAIVLVYQQFENYVLQPTILGKAADVSGFFVIVSVMIFGALLGVIGAIIAVPIIASIQIVVKELTAGTARGDGGPPATGRRHARDRRRDVVGSFRTRTSRPESAATRRTSSRDRSNRNPAPPRGRIIAARILLVLGVLLLVVSILSTYVKREALDSGQFKQTSQQLIADPAIQEAVAAQMTDALANVDFSGALQAKLPTNLQALASPIAGLAQGFVGTAAQNLLARPRIQDAFVEASVLSQKQFVKVLHGDTKAVDTSNGDVVLDIRPLVLKLGDRFGFVSNLADKIPQDAGQITILKSDDLKTAQKVTHWLEQIANFIWIFAVARLGRRDLAGPRPAPAGGPLARLRSRRRRRARAPRALARRPVLRQSHRRQRLGPAGRPQRVADHHAVARRGRLGLALGRHPRRGRCVARRPRRPRHRGPGLRSLRTCGGGRSPGARGSSRCC